MTTLPMLTVAIPTFNRAFYVTTAVESLRGQANVSQRWRVVVVDNNSTDDTAARLRGIAAEWPRLTVVHEPRPGASIARNRALEEANEGYILYVDDECKFPADYIDRALAIIDRLAPAMFGGPIHPWYIVPPPAWFRDDYGAYSLPWATGSSNRISFSAGNMGFSVEALRWVGGFDPARGPRGNQMAFGEETVVENRILTEFGVEAVWFDAELINLHAVRPEKYRWRNMIREHFQRGVARSELSAAGQVAANLPDEAVPGCLRPQPAPSQGRWAKNRQWQHVAIHYGLAAMRRAGLIWSLLRRLGR